MRTNLKLLLAVLIILAALIAPSAARPNDCPLKCAWKNVCVVMPFYEAQGFKTLNECIGDCRHNERAYGCPPRPFEPGPCCKGKCNADTTVCKKKWICVEVCPTPTPTPTPDPCDGVHCDPGFHCEDGDCVCVGPDCPGPTPTPDPCDGVHCDPGFHCEDGDCVCVGPDCPGPTPTPEPPDGGGGGAGEADDGYRDGAGYILWDNLISFTGKAQGFYFHAYNQTNVWVDVRGPKGPRQTIFNTTQEGDESHLRAYRISEWVGQDNALVSGRDGRGFVWATAGGEFTVILLGTNEIDNPDIPRVLAADKMWLSSQPMNGTRRLYNGVRIQEVSRSFNYLQGGIEP